MALKWTDSREIAHALSSKYPEIDPKFVRAAELYRWVVDLEDFDDAVEAPPPRVLDAIQIAWIDEIGEIP